MNIFRSLETHALRDPEKTAVVAEGERISYGELIARVNRLAGALHGLGLKKGDRLALLMHNCPEFVVSFYAAMKLGLITVSLNVMYKQEEASYILDHSQPEALIVHEDYLPVVDGTEAVGQGRLRKIVLYREEAERGEGNSFRDLLRRPEEDHPTVEPGPEGEAVIAYTSGTTGFPKGAVHTHENILVHLEGIRKHLAFDSTDVFLAGLPFFQLVAFLIHPGLALHAGGTVVILEKFEPKVLPADRQGGGGQLLRGRAHDLSHDSRRLRVDGCGLEYGAIRYLRRVAPFDGVEAEIREHLSLSDHPLLRHDRDLSDRFV